MGKLADLKSAAESKLATVHADVTAYISALESKVASNRLTFYTAGAVVLFIVIAIVWHKLK